MYLCSSYEYRYHYHIRNLLVVFDSLDHFWLFYLLSLNTYEYNFCQRQLLHKS